MSGWWLAIALGIGVPSLILAIAGGVGYARDRLARLDADPGPLRVLYPGWHARLRIGRVGDRAAELRFRISQRASQRGAWFGRRPRP